MADNNDSVLEHGKIELEGKTDTSIAYTFAPASGENTSPGALIVFINGLVLPRSGWFPTMDKLAGKESAIPHPPMLAYDRYGQGDSDPDPSDADDTPYGHTLWDAVMDLHLLITQIQKEKPDNVPKFPQLVFVCNSIGCPLVRLFMQKYPRTVSGLLFLDSMIANTDFVSLFPDPDASDFNASELPEGVTEEDLRSVREKMMHLFHPTVLNKEKLDRRNLPELLPYSDSPKLQGVDGEGPVLVVVGHDWETFADSSAMPPAQWPKPLTMAHVNPHWADYNQGLVRLTQEGRAKGPIIAEGCGHFIQKDSPDFVVEEIEDLLKRIKALQ